MLAIPSASKLVIASLLILGVAMSKIRIYVAFVFALTVAAAWPAQANPIMGYYKGQTTGGLSKICYYDAAGEEYTLDVPSSALCPVSHEFENNPSVYSSSPSPTGRSARVGYYKFEKIQGQTRICYYDVQGDMQAITISISRFCPFQASF